MCLTQQNQNTERQVWQRVHSQSPSSELRELQKLIRESSELAAIYRRLQNSFSGCSRELARQLWQTEMSTLHCLRGIGILSRRGGEAVKVWEPGRTEPGKLLEQCYHRTRRCATEYTARSLDPEYGEVFRTLAQQCNSQCARIAQLLGRVGNGRGIS